MKIVDPLSNDYQRTRTIHDELNRIVKQCDEQLVVSSMQKSKLNSRLDNKCEPMKMQELIWHGLLRKQSPRKHTEIVTRYLILLADCILVCRKSGSKLDINRQLSIREITIDIDDNRPVISLTTNAGNDQCGSIFYYPFRVNAVEKSYAFLADRESQRDQWIRKIRQASNDYNRRSSIESSKTKTNNNNSNN
jgi:hypothetical protein